MKQSSFFLYVDKYAKKIQQYPYFFVIILSIALFTLWEASNYLIFEYFIYTYHPEIYPIRELILGLLNAIVISFIVVGFISFAVKRENMKQLEIQSLVNNIHDGLVEVSQTGSITFANNRIYELLDIPRTKTLTNHEYTEIFPIERAYNTFKEFLVAMDIKEYKKGQEYLLHNKELQLKSYKGNYISVLVSLIFIPQKRVYLFIFTDIRPLLKTQEQIKQIMYVEKINSLGHLVAGLGHEINNPLAFLIADTELLDDHIQSLITLINYYKKLDEQVLKTPNSLADINEIHQTIIKYEEQMKYDKTLQDIHDIVVSAKDGLNRIANVVRNVRRYSQMSEQTEKTLSQLNDSVIFALGLVKGQLEKNDITLYEELDSNLPKIMLNPDKMAQAIVNILVNSIQAITAGENIGKIGKITVKSIYDWVNSKIYLEITDNGIGIAEENFSKVFGPYFTTKENGTGFGLGIVRNIVDEHNGEVTIQSKENAFTTVTIKLPVSNMITSKTINNPENSNMPTKSMDIIEQIKNS